MAIQLNETIISLSDACRRLPARRSGKRPHVSCIYRWTTIGVRGIVLESIQVGGTRCTSTEALARFFAALHDRPRAKVTMTDPVLSRRAAQAAQQLDDAGI